MVYGNSRLFLPFMRLLLASFIAIILLQSCKGIDEPIPAYLHIDSLDIAVKAGQGNNIHQIKAIEAYSDGELLGIFELPATIPLHRVGKSKISIVAAVNLNASKNKIAVHSSFIPTDTVLNFEAGKITKIASVPLNYRNNTNFKWLEDFEDNSSTVINISIPPDDTAFIETVPFDLNGKFKGNTKVYSAIIHKSDTTKYIDLGSFNQFENIPSDGRDIFLEFDVKCDADVQLALKRTNGSGAEYVPYLAVYATGENWKRIYVNLVYEIGGQAADTKYQILFSSSFGAASVDRKIQIDNIRLTYNN